MAYVGLFLAIRSGDWQLRVASMKLMAPIFIAFDHQTYQKLIAQHIADILCMPPSILSMFQQGGFVISIGGRALHSVGIDESRDADQQRIKDIYCQTTPRLHQQNSPLHSLPNKST